MDELGRSTLIRSGLVTTASGLTADVNSRSQAFYQNCLAVLGLVGNLYRS